LEAVKVSAVVVDSEEEDSVMVVEEGSAVEKVKDSGVEEDSAVEKVKDSGVEEDLVGEKEKEVEEDLVEAKNSVVVKVENLVNF